MKTPKKESTEKLEFDPTKRREGNDSQILSDDCLSEQEEFKAMGPEEKKMHLTKLWGIAHSKGRAGNSVLRMFNELNKKIQLFGISRNLEDKVVIHNI